MVCKHVKALELTQILQFDENIVSIINLPNETVQDLFTVQLNETYVNTIYKVKVIIQMYNNLQISQED